MLLGATSFQCLIDVRLKTVRARQDGAARQAAKQKEASLQPKKREGTPPAKGRDSSERRSGEQERILLRRSAASESSP